jgi:hypothetical protein
MAMTPLAQRLFDKTKADGRQFRDEIVSRRMNDDNNGFIFSGSTADMFWQKHREHLEQKISEHFEWIERESASISPAFLRLQSINQCVGAVVTYTRQVRNTAIELNCAWEGLSKPLDRGHWDGVDKEFIVRRGERLIAALGLGSGASWSSRLNHIGKDHPWFFHLLTIAAFAISVAAFIHSSLK